MNSQFNVMNVPIWGATFMKSMVQVCIVNWLCISLLLKAVVAINGSICNICSSLTVNICALICGIAKIVTYWQFKRLLLVSS
jgi:hypothetical protein